MGKGRRPRASAPEAIPCSISWREAGAGAASAGTGGPSPQTVPQCGTGRRGPCPWRVPLPGAFVCAVTQQLRGSLVGAACRVSSFPRSGKDAVFWAGMPLSSLGQGIRAFWGAVNTQMQPLALPGVTRRCNPCREERRQHQTHGQGRTKGSYKGESGADSLQREILQELVFGEVFLVEHHRDPDWVLPRRGCR